MSSISEDQNPKPGSGWSLSDPRTGQTWNLGTVSRGYLDGGEEVYKFPRPDSDELPQVGERYVMTHSDGKSINIYIYDDLMGGFSAGKV